MTEEDEAQRDFAAEAAEATAALQTDSARSVYSLRAIEEAWARSLLRLGAKADLAKAVALLEPHAVLDPTEDARRGPARTHVGVLDAFRRRASRTHADGRCSLALPV
jgi:hypothetical protein